MFVKTFQKVSFCLPCMEKEVITLSKAFEESPLKDADLTIRRFSISYQNTFDPWLIFEYIKQILESC